MPAPTILLALALLAAADSADDEARIEQLMHQAAAPAAAPAAAVVKSKRAAARPEPVDPTAALIGHRVRVRTIDRGLYAGTLLSGDAAHITLRIELPKQALNYTLPRSGVAGVDDAEVAP